MESLLQELQRLTDKVAKSLEDAEDADRDKQEKAYRKELFGKVEAWLAANPGSPWAPALRHELAAYQYDRGYLQQAMAGWDENWQALQGAASSSAGFAVANEALGHLLDLNRGYARVPRLRELVDAARDRFLGSGLQGKVFQADRALWLLEHRSSENVMCGPLAMNCINHFLGKPVTPPMLDKLPPEYIGVGLPLTQVARYAAENYRVDARMARRADPSAPIPLPAVVHDKDEHYFAVLETGPAGDEYFIEDRARHFAGWIDREALEARSSGYFLLAGNAAAGALPSGWATVDEGEGNRVFGRNFDHDTSEAVTKCSPSTGCGGNKGMPGYSIHFLPAVLRLGDTPLAYQPPVGYGIGLSLNYLDMDSSAPQTVPNFSHVGLNWGTSWVAWIDHVPGSFGANSVVTVHMRGGGAVQHTFKSSGNPVREPSSGMLLTRSGYTYTRTALDGSKEVYGLADNPASPSRVFLTSLVDAHGNQLTFGYDSNKRLATVTDAIGQITRLNYNDPADIRRITSVVDPFNRQAVLTYNAQGLLASITDQIGLVSSFTYNTSGRVTGMETPYGTTLFERTGHVNHSSTNGSSETTVTVTGPAGEVEMVAYVDRGFSDIDVLHAPPATVSVAGQSIPFVADVASIGSRATFVWKKAHAGAALGDKRKATMMQWCTDVNWRVVPVLQASKEPLEDVVWYNYPGSAWRPYLDSPNSTKTAINLDTSLGNQPTKVLRMLADGTPALTQIAYNPQGMTTRVIDPLGRTTEMVYASNGSDLIQVRQKKGTSWDILAAATYNAKGQPLTVTDAAGKTSAFSYNARGQVASFTDAQSRVSTITYTANAFVQSVNGPGPGWGDATSYGYDALGRVSRVTAPDGYVVQSIYDDFDRVTRTNFPDGTFTENVYDRLSLFSTRDRLGRFTRYEVDNAGRVISVTDPLGRVTRLDWCSCGSPNRLTDARGQITEWTYDLQNRPVEKIYAAGTPEVSRESWTYDQAVGRLTRFTGRNGQPLDYQYFLDGRLKSLAYPVTPGIPATPGVAFTYDAVYGRQVTMTDGIGTTSYAYHPPGVNGAGQVASIDGPWANDTATFTYDSLGRTASTQINGVDFGSAIAYDAFGRMTGFRNALGQSGFTYQPNSGRVTRATAPNGMSTDFTYANAAGDFRLQSIDHRLPGGAVLSKFSYTYDAAGEILSWTRDLAAAGAQVP
ncbi:MAG: hypothetical protein KGS60_19015, partial [Verrucomicrobia bacterium]|nr:hypothetical protein [Verrucomicrobiota bacterium]